MYWRLNGEFGHLKIVMRQANKKQETGIKKVVEHNLGILLMVIDHKHREQKQNECKPEGGTKTATHKNYT